MLDAVLEDWTTADVPKETHAALSLLECMTLRPMELDASFVEGLRESGLDEFKMREAAKVCFQYNLITRMADAFDFPVLEGKQQARLTKMLNFGSTRLRGKNADPLWTRSADGRIRPTGVDRGWQTMLSTKGLTDPPLRHDVAAFVTAQWRLSHKDIPQLSDALTTYLKKLSLYAYRILDEEVDALRAEGYTDEMLCEITVVGAFTAALVGLDQLFDVLYD